MDHKNVFLNNYRWKPCCRCDGDAGDERKGGRPEEVNCKDAPLPRCSDI